MGKENPKHRKKKVSANRQGRFESGVNYRFWLMGALFIGIIVGAVWLVVYLDKDPDDADKDIPEIEDQDIAEVSYKLWADKDRDGEIKWTEDPADEVDIFEKNITKDNFINGFYKNLLGMKEGETDHFFLVANVDTDGNGIDDNTNIEIETYGDPNHKFYNMSLVFWVRIENITKAGEEPEDEDATGDTASADPESALGWLVRDLKYAKIEKLAAL